MRFTQHIIPFALLAFSLNPQVSAALKASEIDIRDGDQLPWIATTEPSDINCERPNIKTRIGPLQNDGTGPYSCPLFNFTGLSQNVKVFYGRGKYSVDEIFIWNLIDCSKHGRYHVFARDEQMVKRNVAERCSTAEKNLHPIAYEIVMETRSVIARRKA